MFRSHGCPLLCEEMEEKHSLTYASRKSALLTVQAQLFTTSEVKKHKTQQSGPARLFTRTVVKYITRKANDKSVTI